MSKGFLLAKNDERFKWWATPTVLSLMTHTKSDTRLRGGTIWNFGWIWTRIQETRLDGVFEGSKDKDYIVRVSFGEEPNYVCECASFSHRPGPCKHVTALMLIALERFEDTDYPIQMMHDACKDARNTGEHHKPWEQYASFSEDVAQEFNARVTEVGFGNSKTKAYEMPGGKLWTGPLPIPEKGERITAYLPRGEKVEATVDSMYEEDHRYIGIRVILDVVPENYTKYAKNMVLFGSEVIRGEGVFGAIKR